VSLFVLAYIRKGMTINKSCINIKTGMNTPHERLLFSAGSGQGQVAGSCECGNEPSDSIKRGEFLD
jgi:hypothetical protein